MEIIRSSAIAFNFQQNIFWHFQNNETNTITVSIFFSIVPFRLFLRVIKTMCIKSSDLYKVVEKHRLTNK